MTIPVSLNDAKNQLRVTLDDPSQDEEIQGFIGDAAAWVERYTGHILEARDIAQPFWGREPASLGAWPIKPGAVPLVTLSGWVGETPAEFVGVRLNVSSRPARIMPPTGSVWRFPSGINAYTVTIRAGYEVGDIVPGEIRRAMLLLIGAYDADREGGDILEKALARGRDILKDLRLRRL